MFVHTCTVCGDRKLVFPSQVTDIVNTDAGIIVAFTCWCSAQQTLVTGAAAAHPEPAVAA